MKESLRALRFMYSYPLRYRGAMALATAVMLLGLLGNIAIPLLMRVAIDVGVLGGDSQLLLVIAVGVLVAGIATTALLHIGKRMRFTVASKASHVLPFFVEAVTRKAPWYSVAPNDEPMP